MAVAGMLFQAAPQRSTELVAAGGSPGPGLFPDKDKDGLNDDFELYLSTASSDISKTTSPFNTDSDGDGQPDGFEYCLSHGQSIYSPQSVLEVVPTITLSCFQQDKDLIVGIHSIPPLDAIDDLIAKIAIMYPDPTSPTGKSPIMGDYLGLMLGSIEAQGTDSYQGHVLGSYQFRVPTGWINLAGSTTIAIRGEVGGEVVGDALTLGKIGNQFYRWRYLIYDGPPESGKIDFGVGSAEPLSATLTKAAGEAEVCGTADRREPTSTPGLLRSVVLAAGCTDGEWACPAGVCTVSGSVGAEKPVIDVFSLISPGN